MGFETLVSGATRRAKNHWLNNADATRKSWTEDDEFYDEEEDYYDDELDDLDLDLDADDAMQELYDDLDDYA